MPPRDDRPHPHPAQLTPKPSPLFGGTLGVIAIALGVGFVAAYTLDAHSHTCDSCGHKWWHLGAFNLGDVGAHRCDRCSAMQWWKGNVPDEFRHAHNAYGHDSWSYPMPEGTVVCPPHQARWPEAPAFVSADPMPLIPSRDRP